MSGVRTFKFNVGLVVLVNHALTLVLSHDKRRKEGKRPHMKLVLPL